MEGRSRRKLLTRLWVLASGFAIFEVLWVVVSFLKPQRQSASADGQKKIIDAGSVDRFVPNSVTAFPQGRFYVSCLEDGGFLALSRRCTHLGCTVPWDAEKEQFVCPCHSSSFTIRGDVVHAPAPRPLDRFLVFIENNRVKVKVDKPIRRSAFANDEVVYGKKGQGAESSKGQG
jgi:cytochrome b6-f complex iron-sulfur subunit